MPSNGSLKNEERESRNQGNIQPNVGEPEINNDLLMAQRWWDNLQRTLDDAGCELDLRAPEDALRLNIVNYVKTGYDRYEFDATYALDPDKTKIDMVNISQNVPDEDLVKLQKTDSISDEVLLNMYHSAKEGLLFVCGHGAAKKKYSQRQILVDEDGLPKVGNDINHLSIEEQEAIEILELPIQPSYPDNETREKALKGDEQAVKIMNNYVLSMEQYGKNLISWNKTERIRQENPNFHKMASNLAIVSTKYYQEWGTDSAEARIEYEERLTKLHQKYIYSKMTPEMQDMYAYYEEVRAIVDSFGDLEQVLPDNPASYDNVLDDKTLDALASLIYYRREMVSLEKRISENDTSGFALKDDNARENEIKKIRESDEFIRGTLFIKNFDLKLLTMKEGESVLTAIDKLDKRIAENSEIAERDTLIRPIFEGINPEEPSDKNEKIWHDLQNLLTDSGFDIDLNSKEDLSRLVITEFDGKDVSAYYATDSEKRKIDRKTITGEEILSRQKPGLPDKETLDNIKKAAAEGRLFVQDHFLKNGKPRIQQIFFDKGDKLSLGVEMDKLNPEQTTAAKILSAPVKPEKPGIGYTILAFLGNQNAKDKLADYNKDMTKYNRDVTKWNEVQKLDKTLVQRVHNQVHGIQDYFYNMDQGMEINKYSELVTDLHRKKEIGEMEGYEKEIHSDLDNRRDEIVQIAENVMNQSKAGIISPIDKINDMNAFNFARAIVSRKEMLDITQKIKNGSIRHHVKSENDMINETLKLYESKEFNAIRGRITNDNLMSWFANTTTEKHKGVEVLDSFVTELYGNKEKKNGIGIIVNKFNKKQISEYENTLGRCMLQINRMNNSEEISGKLSENSDYSKTFATMIIVSKELCKAKDKDAKEFKNIKDLEKDAREYYKSDEYKKLTEKIELKEIANIKGTNGVLNVANKVGEICEKAKKKDEPLINSAAPGI